MLRFEMKRMSGACHGVECRGRSEVLNVCAVCVCVMKTDTVVCSEWKTDTLVVLVIHTADNAGHAAVLG